MYDYIICEDGKSIAVRYMGITGAPTGGSGNSRDYSIELLRMFGKRLAEFIDERCTNLIRQYENSRQNPGFSAALEQFNEVPANARLFLMPFLQKQLEGLVTQNSLRTGNIDLILA